MDIRSAIVGRTSSGERAATAAALRPPTRSRLRPSWPPPTATGTDRRPGAGSSSGFDALLARSRGLLAARIDGIAPPGPVLDVGAGDGTLVDALRARGRETTGIERKPVRDDFLDMSVADVTG